MVPAGVARQTEAQTRIVQQAAPADDGAFSVEEELELSARAEIAGPEIKGGALSNLHLTYIVIALAAVVLVLLIK